MRQATANDNQQAKVQQALNIPYGLFVIDTALKPKSDGQQLQLSLGWLAPNDGINPVAKLVMSAFFAAAAKALAAAARPMKKAR